MKAENGILRGELKVRGGKLIKCRMKVKNGRIEEIKFSGDFFMYPEEKLEELEEMLINIELKKEKIRPIIHHFSENVEMVGADADDIVKVIMKTITN